VHIAHNVVIGENAIAHAMVGGSAGVGAHAWIAPGAQVRDGLKIGNGCLVGLGAVVTKSVADNDIVAGVPAKSIRKG
jgi:UDP-3-O-[3-hydroxymyristoyl] glucosamine N-acyltransferase